MSSDPVRSLDVAETATIDLMALNNRIVSMRNTVKQARVRVIRKLIRHIQNLRKKKGSQEMLDKNKRKADRLVEEIQVVKHLKPDKISKFALGNTISFTELCKKDTASIEARALTRLSENQVVQKEVNKFRNSHSDWKSLSAFLLMKQSGRRYKKKKNKTTTEKIDTNIKARETMMQTYLDKKLGSDTTDGQIKDSITLKSGQQSKITSEAIDDKSGSESSDEDVKSESSSGVERLKKWGDSDSEGGDGEGSDFIQLSEISPDKRSLGSPMKQGLKLEVLKKMFSSRTSSGESGSEEEENKRLINSKQKAKILKEMLPDEGSEDEPDEDSEESTEEDSNEEYLASESDNTKQNSKNTKLEGKAKTKQTQDENRSRVMVVKKINLQDLENDEDLKVKVSEAGRVPDILLAETVPEVKKKKDAFFANSDDSDSGEEREKTSSEEGSEEEEEEAEERKGSFESTFIGTLSHKRKLKRGGHSGKDRESRFRGGSSSYRGRGNFQGGRDRSEYTRGTDTGFRGRGSRGRVSNFRGQGHFKQGGDFVRKSGKDFGFRGDRGRGFKVRGRGSDFQGRGSDRRGYRKQFSDQSSQGQGRRDNSWSRTDRQNVHDKTGQSGKTETLHPSWEASKRKKEQISIHAFQGKKIKFDD